MTRRRHSVMLGGGRSRSWRCRRAVAAQQAGASRSRCRSEEARERNLRAYVELLRSDLRTQKVAVITEMMQFTEAEDAAFWPIYREYELELSRLNDERLAAIETYAKIYDQDDRRRPPTTWPSRRWISKRGARRSSRSTTRSSRRRCRRSPPRRRCRSRTRSS